MACEGSRPLLSNLTPIRSDPVAETPARSATPETGGRRIFGRGQKAPPGTLRTSGGAGPLCRS